MGVMPNGLCLVLSKTQGFRADWWQKMTDEDKIDYGLAEKLSRVVHDECGGFPHDIGIQLAIIVKEHYEV